MDMGINVLIREYGETPNGMYIPRIIGKYLEARGISQG